MAYMVIIRERMREEPAPMPPGYHSRLVSYTAEKSVVTLNEIFNQ